MLGLDMRQLECFVAAASAGSYAAAAKRLFVSPQAVSKGVQLLERTIGVELFERGPGGIALTEFGKMFFEDAAKALQTLERLQGMAERYRRDRRPTLSVGIHSLCFKEHGGTIDWGDLLEFQERHPDVDPSFVEMRGDAIAESLEDGALDFGISVPPSSLDAFEGVELKRFPLAAVVAAGDDYFAAKESVTMRELAGGRLVLFSEELSFNGFFLEEARKEGVSIDVSSLQVRADSDTGFVRGLYTVRPYQHATRTARGADVRVLPILDAEGDAIALSAYVLWRKGRKLDGLDQAFVEMIVGLYRATATVRRS